MGRDVEMKAKAHKEKQDRDEQLAFDQKRRDEELAKQEKEEKALVSKIVREMEQEKVRMAAKKAKQQEMEIEGMREYNRILDQQEQARAEALESRINRQKELMEKMKENVVKQQQAKGDE